ncbi:hypothetical protein [Sutcliffiella sp. NC1]|uniref:hypothetical protein n=1 Tax=Sutcliffiella sp. NC1 TaxID=3004096 RepID=UPI0022DDD607|nr:hypothetical protein [Sutcliffiella sp. NC1]WBL16445.1 hypothetical protein O1A01_07385 [Sutcliffiella sp. NC1]
MAQVTVRKNNKVLNIEDTRLESYLLQGFEQIDKDGKVVKEATGGRTVSLQEHNKALERIKELEEDDAVKELEEAKKEIKALKSENTKLKKSLEELKKLSEESKSE